MQSKNLKWTVYFLRYLHKNNDLERQKKNKKKLVNGVIEF